MKNWFKQNWQMVTILAVATFLRFYKLATLPPGLHPDEAANGLDVISMIEKGKFAAIYDTNGPREALFLYLQGIFVWFGNIFHIDALNYTPLVLRIAPAIIGVVTVWAMYLLGKELYNRNVGLVSAAALAVSAWHIQFSRNGFRAIMAPLALIFLFYFFMKAYKEEKLRYYVATGVALAAGFYTYLSFRMVPLVLGALAIYVLVKDRQFLKKNFKNLAIMGVTFLLFMIPMFIHFYHVPEDIAGRSSTSIFNPELNGGSPIGTLVSNVTKTALMFNVHGDENYRHNLGGTAMLDPIVGILFWVGVVIVLLGIKKIENYLLLMWAGALSLPELLTAEGIPHALRIVGIIPVVFLCVGLAVNWLIERFKAEKYAAYIVMGILVVSGAFGYYKYFVDFPSRGETGEAYAEDMVAIANDINVASDTRTNILVVGEYGTKTVEFITNSTGHTWQRYEARDAAEARIPNRNYKIFVAKNWTDEALSNLRKAGFYGSLTGVKSPIDGRIIYYEYESN